MVGGEGKDIEGKGEDHRREGSDRKGGAHYPSYINCTTIVLTHTPILSKCYFKLVVYLSIITCTQNAVFTVALFVPSTNTKCLSILTHTGQGMSQTCWLCTSSVMRAGLTSHKR